MSDYYMGTRIYAIMLSPSSSVSSLASYSLRADSKAETGIGSTAASAIEGAPA